ncbi:DUF1127 domain-containing protein [Gemmobacter serpentinus]|uniref:DUF1127 domain-containing protein n=1 Tax=Gemmobacter serpentinus TaxID=2652247 RepID=UPI00124CC7FF|nr:DUF1127 domain-containing protein [Gemmobacter serpentinus]
MAHVISNRASGFSFAETVSNVLSNLRAARARRAIYVRTLNELRILSDRDLSDLGISRLQIEDLAFEAAYGK